MKHNFQSFWAGELSPYHRMCLCSFADRGHTFDLYTYQSDLTVPPGISVRDASEILDPEEFFVYAEGLGKGSPAAFANLFRYKLLAERGGWWVDTDVLCLSDDIPAFRQFFATEDDHVANTAVLFFAPSHPLIIRCFEEAKRMGRDVRWGDTGPFLFTRLVEELGYRNEAVSTDWCYAVHHYRATDILRPSRCAQLKEKTKSSLFVHLYNASLDLRGVDKTKLPPLGSILRYWIEQHPIDGWQGEYDEETVEYVLVPP